MTKPLPRINSGTVPDDVRFGKRERIYSNKIIVVHVEHLRIVWE